MEEENEDDIPIKLNSTFDKRVRLQINIQTTS